MHLNYDDECQDESKPVYVSQRNFGIRNYPLKFIWYYFINYCTLFIRRNKIIQFQVKHEGRQHAIKNICQSIKVACDH